jgi:hypothetical protein
MHSRTPGQAGFKRQVVFRIDADDWPLLQAAVREHGSIQAAMLAGIRALTTAPTGTDAPAKKPPSRSASPKPAKPTPAPETPAAPTASVADPSEEISAREAAVLLGLKTSTVGGYIRSGRLAGRYDAEPSWRGWLTTRSAVTEYQQRRG